MFFIKYWKGFVIVLLLAIIAFVVIGGDRRYDAVKRNLHAARTELHDSRELNKKHTNEINRLGAVVNAVIDDGDRIAGEVGDIERTSDELEITSIAIEKTNSDLNSIVESLEQQIKGSAGVAGGIISDLKTARGIIGENRELSETIRARFKNNWATE